MSEAVGAILRVLAALAVVTGIIVGLAHLSTWLSEQKERIDNLPKPSPTPYVVEIDGEQVQCVTFRGALSCEWSER